MPYQRVWPVALETLQLLNDLYMPFIEAEASLLGISANTWGLVLAAHTFDPDVISARRLRVRNPYTAPEIYNQRLIQLAADGILAEDDFPGEYHLTERGREGVRRIIDAAYRRMGMLQPFLLADLERLAEMLRRVVQACLSAPEPPGKWAIGYSRRTDPGERAQVMVRIDQYLTDLAAYRDDAHLAAWQSYGVSGPAWEVLTYLWRVEADRLDKLAHKLAYRGFTADLYAQELSVLAGRGWVTEDSSIYRLTEQGQAIRQQAEEVTDESFYRPWECLAPAELERLTKLLTQLRNSLSSLA